MKTIIVTGGIGSGKSEFCRLLSEISGCAVYVADDKVKQLYSTHPTLLSDIENALQVSLRDDSGRFSPVSLARIIFSDADAMKKVEQLVFPALIEDFEGWKKEHSEDGFAVFESATVLEKEAFDGFGDFVVVVDAPLEVRLQRACARDSADRNRISERMEKQKLMNAISMGLIDARVDWVINNAGSIDDLRQKAENLIQNII